MAKTRNNEQDYIKACKRAVREFEISTYGKVISLRPSKAHTSKMAYKRSKNKKINLNCED